MKTLTREEQHEAERRKRDLEIIDRIPPHKTLTKKEINALRREVERGIRQEFIWEARVS